jgi:hypothetical protein
MVRVWYIQITVDGGPTFSACFFDAAKMQEWIADIIKVLSNNFALPELNSELRHQFQIKINYLDQVLR